MCAPLPVQALGMPIRGALLLAPALNTPLGCPPSTSQGAALTGSLEGALTQGFARPVRRALSIQVCGKLCHSSGMPWSNASLWL